MVACNLGGDGNDVLIAETRDVFLAEKFVAKPTTSTMTTASAITIKSDLDGSLYGCANMDGSDQRGDLGGKARNTWHV